MVVSVEAASAVVTAVIVTEAMAVIIMAIATVDMHTTLPARLLFKPKVSKQQFLYQELMRLTLILLLALLILIQ